VCNGRIETNISSNSCLQRQTLTGTVTEPSYIPTLYQWTLKLENRLMNGRTSSLPNRILWSGLHQRGPLNLRRIKKTSPAKSRQQWTLQMAGTTSSENSSITPLVKLIYFHTNIAKAMKASEVNPIWDRPIFKVWCPNPTAVGSYSFILQKGHYCKTRNCIVSFPNQFSKNGDPTILQKGHYCKTRNCIVSFPNQFSKNGDPTILHF
jgi:hypothetical protein